MKSTAGELRFQQAVAENLRGDLGFRQRVHHGCVRVEIAAVGECESLKKADCFV